MKVLAIIPTLGERDEWLKEAFESVESQTYPTDCIISRGKGRPWGRINKVLKDNPCDYFFVLSDDDKVDPTFVEKTLQFIGQADICSTFLELFGDEGGIHGPDQYPFITSLIKYSIWDKVGGYDNNLDGAGDAYFYKKCLKGGARWVKLWEPLFKYRKHGGQWGHTTDEEGDKIKIQNL
jgi:glycosyltransferase involved in cell wall biosynthesis